MGGGGWWVVGRRVVGAGRWAFFVHTVHIVHTVHSLFKTQRGFAGSNWV